MKTKISFSLPSENLVQILSESGSALDPDLYSSKMLDPEPYPDPHITNADPKHCIPVLKFFLLPISLPFRMTSVLLAPNETFENISVF
jgi:hypothetical protein